MHVTVPVIGSSAKRVAHLLVWFASTLVEPSATERNTISVEPFAQHEEIDEMHERNIFLVTCSSANRVAHVLVWSVRPHVCGAEPDRATYNFLLSRLRSMKKSMKYSKALSFL